MDRRIFIALILVVFTLTIYSYTKYNSYRVESETEYEVLYKNSNGDEIVNITEDEYENFFGDNSVYIGVRFDIVIDESYIQQRMGELGEYDTDTRNTIIQQYYSETFDELVDDIGIDEDKLTVSRYTPFLWVDITNDDYELVQDYINSIMQCEYTLYLQIYEDTVFVPSD